MKITISDLKGMLNQKKIPQIIVFIDQCHTLTKEYVKAFSKHLNRRIEHVYNVDDAKKINARFDRRDILCVCHNCREKLFQLSGLTDIYFIDIETEEPPQGMIEDPFYTVVFPKLNRSQCILYLEDWLIENDFFQKSKNSKEPTLSRENILKLIDYFDNDIDIVMGEMEKLKVLGVHSLDAPFEALYSCLPLKQKRLKALPWYSGGAVDTSAVLFATYMKKLKASLSGKPVSLRDQRWYAQLIIESIFVEVNILAGTFGDYAIEYFRLIERVSPKEMKIQWNPPVTRDEIGEEWHIEEVE